MENYTAETLPGGTRVYINKNHRFGTDAMLLAHFSNIRRDETGCDLGTGCGVIPLKWRDAGHKGVSVGVDINAEAIQLFELAIKDNGFFNTQAVCEDMRTWKTPETFDVVTCNPPYFTGGYISPNPQKATARHEVSCSMEEIAQTATRLLQDGGRFCICQRPERLTDVLYAMRTNKIEPKHIRFVKQRSNDETPWLVLVDGRKGGKAGLHFAKDLIMEKQDGSFSDEVLKIYGKEVKL